MVMVITTACDNIARHEKKNTHHKHPTIFKSYLRLTLSALNGEVNNRYNSNLWSRKNNLYGTLERE